MQKKCYLFMVGSFWSRKAIHNSIEKFPQGCPKVRDGARPGAELVETTANRLLCCGFRRNGNGTSVPMLVEDMSRNECFFQVRMSYVLRFISICDLFTDFSLLYHLFTEMLKYKIILFYSSHDFNPMCLLRKNWKHVLY
jgi:hypothetical protein